MGRYSLCTLTALLFAADARADEAVIARGIGVQVTVADVQAAVSQQPGRLRERYRDPAALRALVDELVRAQLLANEADKRGYQRDPAVVHTVKDSAAQGLVRAEVDDKVTPATIPAEDILAYYEAHPAEFHRPAMRRASIIVFDDAAEAQRVLPLAQKADARAFAELAKQHSREPKSKLEGGDVGYFTREVPEKEDPKNPPLPETLRAAAFALREIGDVSAQPVAYEQKVALVRLTSERPERNVSLDDAASSIRSKLWRERRQQALDALVSKLRARDKPQIFTDRIYAIDFEDMERRPSGFAPDPPAAPKSKP